MKRVKVLAAALPAAVGFAAPAAAATTTAAATAPATHGKKVAYPRVSHHQRITLDATSPTSASSASAGSAGSSATGPTPSIPVTSVPQATATRSCRAHHRGPFTEGDLTAKVQYSKDIGCVGFVAGVLKSHGSTDLFMHVHYYVESIHGHFVEVQASNSIIGTLIDHNTAVSYTHTPSILMHGINRVCETVWHSPLFGPDHEIAGPVCENV